MKNSSNDSMIAWYKFDDSNTVGKDSSGNSNEAIPNGTSLPTVTTVKGRKAITFPGGNHGTSYLSLPTNLLNGVSDDTGITILAWLNLGKAGSVWERIVDLGKGPTGPYLFLTRNLRGDCFAGSDIVADPSKSYPSNEWMHICMTVTGTKGGTLSSAGPRIYVNGEIASDGLISQTTSGTYAKLRSWFATFNDPSNYCNNMIGASQYDADADFCGSLSDLRIYKASLTQEEIIEVMCESLSDQDMVTLAKDRYLPAPMKIVTKPLHLPTSLMGGKVNVVWESSNPSALTSEGVIGNLDSPQGVTLTATLIKGNEKEMKSYQVSVLPKDLAPYELAIDASKERVDISDTLYGLFYEDINNAADGGIYAELIKNRSFEAFVFDTYDARSGENGTSTGRNHTPLDSWFGNLDQVTVQNQGGLNEYFQIADREVNSYYITVKNGVTLYNHGFCDTNHTLSIYVRENEKYDFTIWAKSKEGGSITVSLADGAGNSLSDNQTVAIHAGDWKKYGVDSKITITGTRNGLSKFVMQFEGEISIDMVSLIPENVWGASEETASATAHSNYAGNPNYRLRRDLVEALVDLHPTFLRFPGGCISEGSYIWDNVYDWKDSVGAVELRKENFNVWGYMMTLGLGYMEYFQLAEDLNATPLPVMACGVLCQARSDYANPAGGSLQEKYIRNFTDLIDFAISTDTEGNEWAKLRKSMGHEAPFDLHYLGVGNENWGTEFFASFEIFQARIDAFMNENYPGYDLTIISTAGAQADDDAYQEGWKFLSGNLTGSAEVAFTDGKTSEMQTVTWYKEQPHYMETIVDEHYYRSNEYLLENVDRYNYYYRAYNIDGTIDESNSSKVFVGEYASSDKNTLAGAVAEAAVMTGFENNSDVVRLAATAPLFNKVLTDSTYRWTPDAIWFDDETVWRTPNYYVQQLFAKYIGKKTLATTFETYVNGSKEALSPRGGIEIATRNATVAVKEVSVISNLTRTVLFEQDFTTPLKPDWNVIPGSASYELDKEAGLILKPSETGLTGLYIINRDWSNYTVKVKATKQSGIDGFYVGVGVTEISADKKDAIEYAIAYGINATGVKVYKEGIEAYTLGDYSSSTAAGNLRSSCYEELTLGTEYTITVNYAGNDSKLVCSYTDGTITSKVHDYKLEAYNKDVFTSVTADEKNLFAKLVNADNFDKVINITVKNGSVSSTAKFITLTATEELVHVPNVNGKNDEKVVPTEQTIMVNSNVVTLTLPANSCNVLVLEK